MELLYQVCNELKDRTVIDLIKYKQLLFSLQPIDSQISCHEIICPRHTVDTVPTLQSSVHHPGTYDECRRCLDNFVEDSCIIFATEYERLFANNLDSKQEHIEKMLERVVERSTQDTQYSHLSLESRSIINVVSSEARIVNTSNGVYFEWLKFIHFLRGISFIQPLTDDELIEVIQEEFKVVLRRVLLFFAWPLPREFTRELFVETYIAGWRRIHPLRNPLS